jgi:hypothetical protein
MGGIMPARVNSNNAYLFLDLFDSDKAFTAIPS